MPRSLIRPHARLEHVVESRRAIRVLIVDDSIVARTVFSRLLDNGAFEIVGAAGSAEQAIELLGKHRVDVILLDVEMPGTDGLTALPRLLEAGAGARVLVVSSACAEGAAATVKALTLGAADTLLKPQAGSFAGRFGEILTDRLMRIGAIPAAGEPRPALSPVHGPMADVAPIECLAIGASTGGLHALSAFFGALPADFDAPILVTQHLPAEFMPYFAAQLQDIAHRKATVATDGARLRHGEMLIAPGHAHLGLIRFRDGVRAKLERRPAASGCLPSVDPMFTAVSEIFGPRGVGVVLSGMGRDGAKGAADMVAAGGEILAQDQSSSVIWGMPGAVAAAGLASAILPPQEIAGRIGQRTRPGAVRKNT